MNNYYYNKEIPAGSPEEVERLGKIWDPGDPEDMIGLSTGDADKMEALTDRLQKELIGNQKEVFDMWRQGGTNEQIAHILKIDIATVRSHKRHIKNKVRSVFPSLLSTNVNSYLTDTGLFTT